MLLHSKDIPFIPIENIVYNPLMEIIPRSRITPPWNKTGEKVKLKILGLKDQSPN